MNDQIKYNEAHRPSFIFKSQSDRFKDPKVAPVYKRKFRAEITSKNLNIREEVSLEKSRNHSLVMKKPITYAGEKVGFNILSPRFERTSNKYAPGPGEYHNEDLDQDLSTSKQKISQLLSNSTKKRQNMKYDKIIENEKKKKADMNGTHAYTGHGTLLKKTFNKLLYTNDTLV